MPDDPAYILEVQGLPDGTPGPHAAEADTRGSDTTAGRRRWIGIHFECCGVYARIYRNPQETAYLGYCPRCQRRLSVPIGPGGTHQRLFRAR